MQAIQKRLGTDHLQRSHRRYIERIAEGLTQSDRPIVDAAVVVKGVKACADRFGQRAIVDERRSGPASLERHRIEQGLHRRARLAWREHGVVSESLLTL